MRCSTKSSGMATVAVLAVLLAAPGEIPVSPAAAATASQSKPFVPNDDPAPDCATHAGNPACLPPDPNPPRHRHGSPVVGGPPLAPFNMPPMVK
jgi:hypothetical protein